MQENLRHPDSFESSIEKISQKLNITEDFVDNAVFLTKYPSYFPVGTLRRPAASLSQAVDFAQGDSVIVVYPGDYSGEEPVTIPAMLESLKIVGIGDKSDIILPPIVAGTDGESFFLNVENVTFFRLDDGFSVEILNGVQLEFKNVSILNDFSKSALLENEESMISNCIIEGRLESNDTSQNSFIKISDTLLINPNQSELAKVIIKNKTANILNSDLDQDLEINSSNTVIKNIKTNKNVDIASAHVELKDIKVNGNLAINGSAVVKTNCKIGGILGLISDSSTLKDVEIDEAVSISSNSSNIYSSFFKNNLTLNSSSEVIFNHTVVGGVSNITANNLKIAQLNSSNNLSISSVDLKINNLFLDGDLSINSQKCKCNDVQTSGNVGIASPIAKVNDFIIGGNFNVVSSNLKVSDAIISGDTGINNSSGKINDTMTNGNFTVNDSNIIFESVLFKRGANIQTPSVIQTNGEMHLNNAYFEKNEVAQMINDNVYVFSVGGSDAKVSFGLHNIDQIEDVTSLNNGATSYSIKLGKTN